MRRTIAMACAAMLLAAPGCTNKTVATPSPQLGVNFIRYFWGDDSDIPEAARKSVAAMSLDRETAYVQPEAIWADFERLGVQAQRHLVKADLGWNTIEPKNDSWNFTAADEVIKSSGIATVVTLFSLQYASPTPPWAKPGAFQKTLGPEAKDYLDHVIDRYGSTVTYWEIGNEMDHWRSEDPGAELPKGAKGDARPRVVPSDGFSPEEQGRFFAEVAAYVRSRDADAVIVLPGMSTLNEYTLDTWFAGVISGGGTNAFDIIGYHAYQPWDKAIEARKELDSFVVANNLQDKPVWMTETGSTSDQKLKTRTNYPNSESSQAADVFRRIVPAYAAGDALALWHTYVGSPEEPGNTWGGYGLLTDTGERKMAYWSFWLLAKNVIPFESITRLESDPEQFVYSIKRTDGTTAYVAWGKGSYAFSDAGKITNVIASDDSGTFSWQTIGPDEKVALTEVPVLAL